MKERNIREEFFKILTAKDCNRYSPSAKSNYEDAISKMDHTLGSIQRKLNNGEYTKYQPSIDESVLDYYDAVINSFKSSLENFIKTGNWTYKEPQVSSDTLNQFNNFMDVVNKHGAYFDGRPETVNSVFNRVAKNLTKKGFSASDLNQKRTAEEEAKKPKLPDVISYTKFDSYDPTRMKSYKPNSRGEQMAHTAFLDKRGREFREAKSYIEKYPILKDYLNDIFNAFDNTWFSYASDTTNKLDFTEVDNIFNKYTTENPIIKNFDTKVCGQRMYVGGTATIWDCKDAMYKMANNREKVVKTVTMKKEDTYSKWEKSVDAILNEEGKPSLNSYLENWVNEITAYYTDSDNIKNWKDIDKRLSEEIEDLENQMNQIGLQWGKDHANDKNITWKELHNGYKILPEYEKLERSRNSKNSVRLSNSKDLNIAKMGESKIRKMFEQQAADAKKSFITAVCERAGTLKGGVFYWSAQNTGHLNGTVIGETGSKWRITSFFAGGYNIQKLHVRTKITELVN